jgi:hypothetical protein
MDGNKGMIHDKGFYVVFSEYFPGSLPPQQIMSFVNLLI